MNWKRLRTLIETDFDEEELKTLCFDLKIEYESLAGTNKPAKIRELIKRCQREKKVDELILWCREMRPRTEWPFFEESIANQAAHKFSEVFPWVIFGVIFLAGLLVAIIWPESIMNMFTTNSEPSPTITIPTHTTALRPTAVNTPTPTPTNLPSPTITPSATPKPVTSIPLTEVDQPCGNVHYDYGEHGNLNPTSNDDVVLHWEWLEFGVSNIPERQAGYKINVYVNSADGISIIRDIGTPAVDTLDNKYVMGNELFQIGITYLYTVEFYAPESEEPFCVSNGEFVRE